MNVSVIIQNLSESGTKEFNLLLASIPIIFTIITYSIFEKKKFIIIDKIKNKKKILKSINDILERIIFSNDKLEMEFKKITGDGYVENSGKCLEEIQNLQKYIIDLSKFYRSYELYITRRIEKDIINIKSLIEAEYLILSQIMIGFTISEKKYAKLVKEVLGHIDKEKVMHYSDQIDSKKHVETISKANNIFKKIKTKYERKFRRLLKIRKWLG